MAQESCAKILPQFIAVCVIALNRFLFYVLLSIFSWLRLVVFTSAVDCLERLVCEMTCYE